MRVALLADIHGNAAALHAVLGDACAQGVETLWFLGDIVGYGPLPARCVKLLDAQQPAIWLQGNHDLAGALMRDDPEEHAPLIRRLVTGLVERHVVAWHVRQLEAGLPADRLRRLAQTPAWCAASDAIWVAHGAIVSRDPSAPQNVMGRGSYVLPGNPAHDLTLDTLAALTAGQDEKPWLVVVGHTHKQALCHAAWNKPRRWTWHEHTRLPVNAENPVSLGALDDPVTIACPGSVGQPRFAGGDPRAAYAILDTERRQLWFRRVPYDVRETWAAMVQPDDDVREAEDQWKKLAEESEKYYRRQRQGIITESRGGG